MSFEYPRVEPGLSNRKLLSRLLLVTECPPASWPLTEIYMPNELANFPLDDVDFRSSYFHGTCNCQLLLSLVYTSTPQNSCAAFPQLGHWGHRAQCCRKTPTTRCNLPAVDHWVPINCSDDPMGWWGGCTASGRASGFWGSSQINIFDHQAVLQCYHPINNISYIYIYISIWYIYICVYIYIYHISIDRPCKAPFLAECNLPPPHLQGLYTQIPSQQYFLCSSGLVLDPFIFRLGDPSWGYLESVETIVAPNSSHPKPSLGRPERFQDHTVYAGVHDKAWTNPRSSTKIWTIWTSEHSCSWWTWLWPTTNN